MTIRQGATGHILEQNVSVLPESLATEEGTPVALTLNQARSVYDRIGRVQDWQAFYEDATTDGSWPMRRSMQTRRFSSSGAAPGGWLRTF